MKKMMEKFQDLNISKKMLMMYIVFAGIFFIIALISLQVSFKIYSQKLYEKSLQELDFFSQKVNDGLDDAERLNYNISMDTVVQQNLSEMMNAKHPSVDYNQKLYKMRNILLNEYDPQNCVRSMIYIDPYGVQQEIGTTAWNISEESRKNFFELAENANGAYVTYGPTEECPYLIGGRVIRNRLDMSLNNMGMLIFTCDISGIVSKNKDRLEAQQASICVYSENGMIYQDEEIESGEIALPEFQEKSGYQIVNKKGKKYFVCYLYSKETEWMYVNYFPYSDIYGQVQATKYTLFACFAIVFLLLVLCMKRVADVITEPLEHLTASMQIVETGDFKGAKEFLTDMDRKDEIGILTKEFRIMVDQVDLLIRENYEKQLLLKDTKYKMLRAQINPHFLYNTLNVINWMIKAGRNAEAGKMIVQLGAILHYSFATDPYATVKDEIDMVSSFIAIQKMRYQGRIEFAIETSGNLDHYLMPRMILQPLVENAINYGAEPYLDVCRITVSVKEEKDQILLIVEDTGAGMSEDELQSVRNMNFTPKGHGIGIKNIVERIKMDDKDNVFDIDSEIGKGTIAKVIIYKKGESENV